MPRAEVPRAAQSVSCTRHAERGTTICRMKRTLLILLFATSVFAADKPIVLRAARLIDGRGGSVVSPAMVVVRGNRIESIGGSIPADAETIDLGDMTLLPGLIDAHTHVLLQGDVTSADYDTQLFRESLPYRALRASRAGLQPAFRVPGASRRRRTPRRRT